MIVLIAIEDFFAINYFRCGNTPGYLYIFREDQLSERTVRQLRSVVVHGKHIHSYYQLSAEQEEKAAAIFHKIQAEKNMPSVCTDALQQTYLTELIHFIMKLHLAVPEPAYASVN